MFSHSFISNSKKEVRLNCIVECITCQHAENGYSVRRVKMKGYDDFFFTGFTFKLLLART
ncbi:hypothetical protein IMSAGC004_02750 [Bacteroidaceae bacterium]|nr:hypothetical protein IMSAGC004_02750 [Bacteroidaceae bacterium]